MPYCVDCGQHVADELEYCGHCGTRVRKREEENTIFAAETPNVLCPNCGVLVDYGTKICPTCSYEIQGPKATPAVKEFTGKLSASLSDDQKASIIKYYPVPNSKDDILDFIFMSSSNITGERNNQVLDAWSVKLEQCYQKAQLIIHDRVILARVQDTYDQTKKLITNQKRWQGARAIKDALFQPKFSGANLVHLLAKNLPVIAGMILYLVSRGANAGGMSNFLVFLGSMLFISSASSLYRRNASLLEYLFSVASGLLAFHLSGSMNSTLLQLTGGIVLFLSAKNFINQANKNNRR